MTRMRMFIQTNKGLSIHRYIKQLFLVLGIRIAQFERYCSVVKCVLDGPLDTHIWPFSRTLGEEILHLYSIYCFWVPFSGRISHHFPTKPSFSPIFRIARLFENFLYQSISILTWPGAFSGPILLIRTKPDLISFRTWCWSWNFLWNGKISHHFQCYPPAGENSYHLR